VSGMECGNCDGALDMFDAHLTECWETIGEFYCAECWEEMCEANAAYELEDAE
jgi:hypothetical protein